MKVFIYGTLKRGQFFHDEYLKNDKSVFLGEAITSTDYIMYTDGLPHMIKEKSEKGVKGELYEVDQDILSRLDALEGHPLIYYRDVVECYDEKGEKVLAWAYLRPVHFKGKMASWPEFEFT